ncbi:hypothetical protein GCM10027275_22090 [Rhabdobacter roseus]|uniref:L-alanine-DL-glutamate epimerase-like enolase superfamily enzyme n=1 Tax=Rhabdobacter roseus TaxID=1655419 RepID=A0A840TL47_9BACT|nr:enolase C-terminal domain-like protein [Rhabdobacter roseus]MBB5284144.1 L-alanine-DL-glutamate epimerase-like enolase superfamily enzyme [Rhabdobacter roseus]
MHPATRPIRVIGTQSNFEREKLIRPFGFKGGYLTELWQTVSQLSTTSHHQIGLATQSVLYGDAELFASYSEAGGNALMYALTEKALRLVRQIPFHTPLDLQSTLFPALRAEAITLTGKPDLHENFILNALVSIDNAAWLLYAAEHGLRRFEDMLPESYRPTLAHRNANVAVLFQVPYGMPVAELRQAVEQGYFVFKIKTGQPGSQSEMLEKDLARLTDIHAVLGTCSTPQTAQGKVWYTLDANGRYEQKETLARYLDHARKIGAAEQILFVEEPFPEQYHENVADLGVRIAADESVHDADTARQRLEQGYGALVLKGIAKTLSRTLEIAQVAHERQVPCLCADLTANPILVDWNKNVAARLAPFPELGMGLLETNGDMNYLNWPHMQTYHPAPDAPWTRMNQGTFALDEEYYRRSGGVLEPSPHYLAMFPRG